MKNSIITLVAMFLLLSSTNPSQAEIIPNKTIPLNSGWNVVFLDLEPENPDAAVVFAPDTFTPNLTAPASIWKWSPRTSTVEFIQNPDVPVPEESQWMVYYTGDAPEYQFISNLHAIHGDTPYLIYISGGAVEWTISGEPTIPHIDWKSNSYNFVGFHLDPETSINYSTFFDASFAHAGQKIYTLESGNWVEKPDTEFMEYGKAFWIYCNGSSEFTGPLSVQLEQGSGLHYGTTLNEQDLRVFNHSETDKTAITLSFESPNVPLYYWVFDPDNNLAGWEPFPPDPLSIPVGESQKLRLGVKRAGLAAETLYEANMTITDAEGMNILVPVSVTGISYSGLWVGNATINKVSEPANVFDSDTPVKTGTEFSFQIIFHADDTGVVRLLSQVIQMWHEGTWKPDPNDLGKQIVDLPGYFVLFTDDGLIPTYSGSAMRDGQLVGRRISAPAFPNLTADQGEMGGTAVGGVMLDPSAGNTLTRHITLAPDDPTNPFRHMYHPDHKLTDQSYLVERDINLTFAHEDTDGRPITGVPTLSWGSSEIGGIYKEDITGIHKDAIHFEGTFLLHKVNNVGTLTQ